MCSLINKKSANWKNGDPKANTGLTWRKPFEVRFDMVYMVGAT